MENSKSKTDGATRRSREYSRKLPLLRGFGELHAHHYKIARIWIARLAGRAPEDAEMRAIQQAGIFPSFVGSIDARLRYPAVSSVRSVERMRQTLRALAGAEDALEPATPAPDAVMEALRDTKR